MHTPPKGGPGGPGGPGRPVEKAKDFKGTVRKLLKLIAPFKHRFIAVIILAAASSIFTVIGPKILASATNEVADGVFKIIDGTGTINFSKIAQILLILVFVYLISSLFSYLQSFIMSGVTTRLSFNLRNNIMQKINRCLLYTSPSPRD